MICKICKREFYKNAKTGGEPCYCSEECRRTGRLATQKKWRIEHPDYYKGKPNSIAHCRYCGEEFKKVGCNVYCSKECRRMMYNKGTGEPRTVKPKPKKKIMSIEEVNRLAREAGMTYGQYIAEMEGRKIGRA